MSARWIRPNEKGPEKGALAETLEFGLGVLNRTSNASQSGRTGPRGRHRGRLNRLAKMGLEVHSLGEKTGDTFISIRK